jgi:hypothetical protein
MVQNLSMAKDRIFAVEEGNVEKGFWEMAL